MNTNTKKKVYLCPMIEVQEVEAMSMLAASIHGKLESAESMNVEDWSGESARNSSESMNHSDWSDYGW